MDRRTLRQAYVDRYEPPGPGDVNFGPEFEVDDDADEVPDDWGIEDRVADADDSWMDDI